MADDKPEPTCEQCGFPLSSRLHLEGRGNIHVASAPEFVDLSSLTNRELTEMIELRGLQVPKPPTKANLIAALSA